MTRPAAAMMAGVGMSAERIPPAPATSMTLQRKLMGAFVMLSSITLAGSLYIFLSLGRNGNVDSVRGWVLLTGAGCAVLTIAAGLWTVRRIGVPLTSPLGGAVAALRASEARLRLLGDNLPGCMVYEVLREPGCPPRFLYVSAGIEHLHGVSAPAAMADPNLIFDQILPEDRPARRAAEEAAIHGGGVFHIVTRIRRPDQALRTVSVWSQARRDEQGRWVWDGLEMDVTERVRMEAEHGRLARVIDSHRDGAYWMDSSDCIRYVNDAGCRAVGYARDELLGAHISLISPRATSSRLKEVWAAIKRDGTFTAESIHRRKDGSEFPVEIMAAYVNQDGEDFYCGFARDITAPKLAADELRAQLGELKRWQQLTLDRESRVLELKAEINALCEQWGQPARYASALGVELPAESDR
ncbi:MAG TPA: PAS domain S-box protein [Opitutaceae bacterium]|jgi:PAS domain S-box-containing protein